MDIFFRQTVKVIRLSIFTVVVLLMGSTLAMAQSSPKFSPKGVTGYAGAGFASFTVKNPTESFKLDQGSFATLGGEKGFGLMNLYLTFGFGYLTTKGQTAYDYTTLNGENYTANDVNFKTEVFQASLGLRLKIIDGYFIRPYVEGGGNFGYYTLKYEFSSTQKETLNSVGTNYKKEDSIIDIGHYLEAGAEISFSDRFGLRPAVRLIRSETKDVETLNKQKIHYDSEIYYLGLLVSF